MPKQWTVLVYIAGDNNLDSAGVADLTEIKEVGSTDSVNVVAQFDRSGRTRTTKRYFLRHGTTLAQDKVGDLGETNSGDPAVLEAFVLWGLAEYPAAHYLVILWNHGAGWDDSNIYEAGGALSDAPPPVSRRGLPLAAAAPLLRGAAATRAPVARAVPQRVVRAGLVRSRRALFSTTVMAATTRALAFDDNAKDFLDNLELQRTFARIRRSLRRKVDIIGMDACLMSMAEVAYQLRAEASLMVGSQETEPNEGWPYKRILRELKAKPAMTPDELAQTIVAQYVASYGANTNVTQSATRLDALDAVRTAVDALGAALAPLLDDARGKAALMQARASVQEYEAPYDDYVDLGDIADLVAAGTAGLTGAASIQSCRDLVRAALAGCVLASAHKGDGVAHSTGLSVYFPKKKVSALYGRLAFAGDGPWAKFIAAYVDGVRRRPG